METKKNEDFYECKYCDFICCYKSDWNRHIMTRKHKKWTNGDFLDTHKKQQKITLNETTQDLNVSDNITNITKNTENKITKKNEQDHKCYKKNESNNSNHLCICGKQYNSKSGFYKHKKHSKCVANDNNQNSQLNDLVDLVKMLVKENSIINNNMLEHQNNIIEAVKNGITNNITNNNNNINSHNKTFNLQVFLNETCKDAMNINDFVDSIKLQLSDFERIGEVGYAQGISDIITSNLQALDITQRPVHCTDKKRETMYVKDQDQWMKEDDNKSKIKKMIKRIENKNIQNISQFQKKYPNYANPKSHESDKYHKTIIEAMGGPGGSEGKEGKIIRNISKVTTIREKE